ncbi:hypothetical protein Gain_0027_054 [Komagataeibacter intermedius TF2]|uniref:Uncharacterized protein n=1 Tax=Komagataeibacter intermedius NRIC 0521 TaxID=1307934 RepID=A0ABQ0PGN6_9PROT|nr:hypothetical protein [Komagataeibacter intermedius]GAN86379.1 hypothetical protein Gain_0027_054 [Komagataeibacter intermedius TF2]GBQ68040.1 hypothetical protein AA0521_1137 [Komagataeibacter intermedius NRIC 0521]
MPSLHPHRLPTDHTFANATQGEGHAIANKFSAFGAIAIHADQSEADKGTRFLTTASEAEAAEGR